MHVISIGCICRVLLEFPLDLFWYSLGSIVKNQCMWQLIVRLPLRDSATWNVSGCYLPPALCTGHVTGQFKTERAASDVSVVRNRPERLISVYIRL